MPPGLERQMWSSEQWKKFMKLSPGAFASCNGSGITTACGTERVTQVTETINSLKNTVTHIHLLEGSAVDWTDTRLITTAWALICRVFRKSSEARTFLVDPEVASRAQD